MGKHGLTPALYKGEGECQRYELWPNPNVGQMTLLQAIADNGIVSAEVMTVIGATLAKQDLHFIQRMTQLWVNNIAPGLYLQKLIDNAGKVYVHKFVVQ